MRWNGSTNSYLLLRVEFFIIIFFTFLSSSAAVFSPSLSFCLSFSYQSLAGDGNACDAKAIAFWFVLNSYLELLKMRLKKQGAYRKKLYPLRMEFLLNTPHTLSQVLRAPSMILCRVPSFEECVPLKSKWNTEYSFHSISRLSMASPLKSF